MVKIISDDTARSVQKQWLETCLNLPSYDYKVERVYQETVNLFASEELRQRLKKKGKML